MTTAAMSAEPEGLSRPDTKAGRLQRACLDLLQQHERDDALPTNCTFLFYELEQQGSVPKHYRNEDGGKRARTPRQDVSDATMRLREVGLVPWEWLVDESRTVDEWESAPSVYEYAIAAIERARIDCWGGESAPLILCEARSMKGVLSRITARYLAPIGATGGQSAGYLVNDIAPLLSGNTRPVLYIGDHELRGPADQIEANTRRYLEKHARRTFDKRTWKRIALTEAQVNADRRLRGLVITKLDRRYKPPREYQAVECEAVGQATLERMLRAQLDARLPEPLQRVLVREKRQRAEIARLLNGGGAT
jgi:hypothetical protein